MNSLLSDRFFADGHHSLNPLGRQEWAKIDLIVPRSLCLQLRPSEPNTPEICWAVSRHKWTKWNCSRMAGLLEKGRLDCSRSEPHILHRTAIMGQIIPFVVSIEMVDGKRPDRTGIGHSEINRCPVPQVIAGFG